MEIKLTNKEVELIVFEIINEFKGIQEIHSRDKKGEFKFDNFERLDKSDFDLKEAEITDYEFKCYFSILSKLKQRKDR